MRFQFSVLVVAMLAASSLRPPSSLLRPQSSSVDALFSPWASATSPGCAVGVYRNGAIAVQKGYGMASLEHDAPITPKTVFYVGSISKQFTAMAAALAIQQGRLAYEDPIRKYLPELPAYADAIKVRHLIHHTSGLRDYNTLLSIAGRRDEDAWDNRVVLQITARQTALNFDPGSEYLYSNTGYTLLATIVERATGMKFADFADAAIFKPLGMTATHYHTDARRLVPGRAMAYGGRAGLWTLNTPINERAGAGGVYTNLIDLQKWDENFYTAKVGGPAVLTQVQTPGTLNGGTPQTYAWGLTIGEYRGQPIVEHGGSLGGYRAHLIRFPQPHVSVALLCNEGSINPSALARRVADLEIGGQFTQPVPSPAGGGVAGSVAGRVPDSGTAAANREYAGTYFSEEVNAGLTVSADGNDVRIQRETDPSPIVLQATGPADQFSFRGMTVRFQRDANKKVVSLTVDAGRVRGIRFVRR